jgi:Fe-S cluster biogenesis protein NfuA
MPSELNNTLKDRVESALEFCRPYLQKDGGDVVLERIGDDGVVEVSFRGTCIICPMSRMTLRAGIERAILKNAPEIKRVEAITPPVSP